jgi:nucleotide-binding universal stress UspA family protein
MFHQGAIHGSSGVPEPRGGNAMAIVVGTDFSEHALEAIRVAAAIAKNLGTALALVHVAEPSTIRRTAPAERHAVLAPLEQQLAAEAERLRRDGLTVEHEVLLGVPDEAMVDYARTHEAQMIVASALGWRSEKRWRLGSVAERIAETTRCPFLMVRSAAPLLDWCGGKQPLKVVVGDDFSSTAEAALRWLPALRRVGPLELVVVHAYWPMTEYSRLGMYHPEQGATEIESILQRKLHERLLRLGESQAKLRIVMSYGRVADPLVMLAAEEKADLLLLGTHQRRGVGRVWHGSVSHTSLHLAPMAVACVPVGDAVESAAPADIPAIRRVLVPTDFSSFANMAIPHACSLLPNGGELFLVHVIESMVPVVYRDFWTEAALSMVPTAEEREGLRRQLEALVPREAERQGITTQVEVMVGAQVAQTLSQAGERHGVDVICIGSHGRSGVRRVVLGSVAQEVMALSRRPVLVIRPPAET